MSSPWRNIIEQMVWQTTRVTLRTKKEARMRDAAPKMYDLLWSYKNAHHSQACDCGLCALLAKIEGK